MPTEAQEGTHAEVVGRTPSPSAVMGTPLETSPSRKGGDNRGAKRPHRTHLWAPRANQRLQEGFHQGEQGQPQEVNTTAR